MRALEKEDNFVSWPDFNKILLDLEIYGLIRVSWVTKDKRRIETAEGKGFKIETVDSVGSGTLFLRVLMR